MNGDLIAHADVLPYNMALRKTYERDMRHFSWRHILGGMNEAPFADIAARIKWHRSLEGLNQQGYADRAKIKRSQLSNWETGQQRISVDGALALRDTYGLSLDFIYAGIDDTLPMSLRQALRERPLVKASR